MNTNTGKILDLEEIPASERKHYIEVKRDLSKKEALNRQIQLYSPCACGSGKKFKFCCKTSK